MDLKNECHDSNQNDNLIKEIEKLNSDYINLESGKIYQIGRKVDRLKKDFFKTIYEIVWVRWVYRNVHEVEHTYNMSYQDEEALSRWGNPGTRTVVYTCVTGDYDQLNQPYLYPNNIDFVLYSDHKNVKGWINRELPNNVKQYSNSLKNRYIKFHPHELFGKDYDFSIYIDGNITPISDLSVMDELVNKKYGLAFHSHRNRDCIYDEAAACRALHKGNYNKIIEQLNKYEKEGFPHHYGMVEGNVIVTDLHSHKSYELLSELWNEVINSNSGRDQIAWPYIFWKNKIQIKEVCTLGMNAYKNPKIRIGKHR